MATEPKTSHLRGKQKTAIPAIVKFTDHNCLINRKLKWQKLYQKINRNYFCRKTIQAEGKNSKTLTHTTMSSKRKKTVRNVGENAKTSTQTFESNGLSIS